MKKKNSERGAGREMKRKRKIDAMKSHHESNEKRKIDISLCRRSAWAFPSLEKFSFGLWLKRCFENSLRLTEPAWLDDGQTVSYNKRTFSAARFLMPSLPLVHISLCYFLTSRMSLSNCVKATTEERLQKEMQLDLEVDCLLDWRCFEVEHQSWK